MFCSLAPLAGIGAAAVPGGPIRPLAQSYVVVGRSPAPALVSLYSPTILRLDSGRLVAGYERATHKAKGYGRSEEVLLTSDDHGRTWTERAETPALSGRLFSAGRRIYYLAIGAGMPIMRSGDAGLTWSPPVCLTSRSLVWQQTAANVWKANGCVYLAFGRRTAVTHTWSVSDKALVLMRAPLEADLTNPKSWTFSNELVFADVVPGVRTNQVGFPFFGIPFFKQNYPFREVVSRSPRRTMSPIGWVEPEVVQILDPNNDWFDPTGHTFLLLARAHTGGTGYACITKVVEDADGSMTMSLEREPSGETLLYLPLPGGQMRFHILYDAKTKLYWLLDSQATDSMTRPDRLPRDRYDLPNNERQRLVLHFSRNLVDWCFAGLVAIGGSAREARSYASMAIDGDDLVILSRSGDADAKSAHETDLITFHRVKNFRQLVY